MEWQTIDIYDSLKRKPKYAVFYFPALERERKYASLTEQIGTSRRMGDRECTHFKNVGKP